MRTTKNTPASTPAPNGSLANPNSQQPAKLSQLLLELRESAQETISMGDLAHALRRRSLGAFMLIFAIPCIMPFPPFATIILGMPLVIIAWQMAQAKQEILLPKFLTNRAISADKGCAIIDKSIPIVQRIERAVKPRFWTPMRNSYIANIASLFMLIVAITVVLPIPFGNWLPAMGCALYGAALTQRDGIILVISLAISLLSVLLAMAVIWYGQEIVSYLTGPILGLF